MKPVLTHQQRRTHHATHSYSIPRRTAMTHLLCHIGIHRWTWTFPGVWHPSQARRICLHCPARHR